MMLIDLSQHLLSSAWCRRVPLSEEGGEVSCVPLANAVEPKAAISFRRCRVAPQHGAHVEIAVVFVGTCDVEVAELVDDRKRGLLFQEDASQRAPLHAGEGDGGGSMNYGFQCCSMHTASALSSTSMGGTYMAQTTMASKCIRSS